MRTFTGTLLVLVLLTGCTTLPDMRYQSAGFHHRSCSLTQVGRDAICPAEQTHAKASKNGRVERHFSVAYLEYCELKSDVCKGAGEQFDPEQLQAILKKINASNAAGEPTLVAVYVHGWHHNADPDDENVKYFEHMLARYKDALVRTGMGEVQVFGVYVGWRGESIRSPIASPFTVWSRGRAADAIGSRGTIASDLEAIASAVQKGPEKSRLIVTGHSYGGRLISRALLPKFRETYRPLGDRALIVTLNAAVGADAFDDFYQSPRLSPVATKPTWVNITSLDDWATRHTYPIARRLGDLRPDHPNSDSSRATIGQYPPYKTHQISFANCDAVKCGNEASIQMLRATNYWSPAPFHFFVLQYVPESSGSILNMCGLIREYPYNQKATSAMDAAGVCGKMVGTESPHTGRKSFPANGHLWNIEGDSSVIDSDGLQATSTPVHNSVTQTTLATILMRLLYAE